MAELENPIKSEEEFRRALERIHQLFEAEPGTLESEELDKLCDLVEAYDKANYPIPKPTPDMALRGRMDNLELTVNDLATHLGSMEVASGILAGKIMITPELADSLHEFLNIPVEDLLPEATTSPG